MKKCFYFPTWEEKKIGEDYLDAGNSILILELYNENYKSNAIKECIARHSQKGGFNEYKLSIPTDKILKKLCELTGAKMYQDYIVLDDSYTNTFEEYSKFLRKEENKWEEVKPSFRCVVFDTKNHYADWEKQGYYSYCKVVL